MTDEVLNQTAQTRLRTIIERIERVELDMDGLKGDRKEIYAEAKGEGFDVTILRRVVRLRKMDNAKRQEIEAMIDLYFHAIGGV